MDAVSDVLADLRAGRMVVLVDDAQRENEGDLVCPAGGITADDVNFMLRAARGLLCVALGPERCDRLELGPQAGQHPDAFGTAFTVSVDAHERFGITTGVSAADRAGTIRTLASNDTRPEDLRRPGHVHPLRAREGGTLVRAGQTEGSVDLCRLAGLPPAAAIIEIMNEDGTMARQPQLQALCRAHGLKMCSVADVIEHRMQREQMVERLEEAPFETEAGPFHLIAYRSLVDPLPHVALVHGDLGRRDSLGAPVDIEEPVLVRMHSQNLLGDVFGDRRQPTHRRLAAAMRAMRAEKRGAIVYLRHEQMGSGLLQRLQTRRAPGPAPATHAAPDGDAMAQPPVARGSYGIGAQILRDLGIRRLRLLTDHPFVPTALSGYGLEVEGFVPLLSAGEGSDGASGGSPEKPSG
jgi:3,4-dihydroxy 2-butanone 4-phosphate synthase/GTP cyclohydrolase II